MYNFYPDCHLYLINFAPGSAGCLLASVISYMLMPNALLLSEQENYTNAHDTLFNTAVTTWTDETCHDLGYNPNDIVLTNFSVPVLNTPAGVNSYQRIKPKDKTGFVVGIDHTTVYNYNSLASVYPNFTEFLITIKPEDKNQLDFTIFLKFMCELEPSPRDLTWKRMKNTVLRTNPQYIWLNQYERPKDILANTEHYHLFVKSYFTKPTDTTFLGKFDYRNYERLVSKNQKYKDNIHSIDFKTTMTDSEAILNQVSSILQLPITDNARFVYNRWIKNQVRLDMILDK